MKIYRQVAYTEILDMSTRHTKMTVEHYWFGIKVWVNVFEDYKII